jgi:hypothetical protein
VVPDPKFESSLVIDEHYTDTGGFSDHLFAACHFYGLRYVPRIRDLKEKRLYIALVLLLSVCIPVPPSIRTTMLCLSTGVLLLLQALLSHAIDKEPSRLQSTFSTRSLSLVGRCIARALDGGAIWRSA